ncbi:hypothetical protein [Halarchaeum sp. P4]|uniref:hypothetical protein n=1 Tax=Halarchaeum sp. P4 TaxID=3421639 RepID=UPI003EBDAE78
MLPTDVDTDVQPPMRIPLGHFVVALALLLAAVGIGLDGGRSVSLSAGLAHVHLLLVGWVCVTIAGAMTQFVPVWSGVRLHSRRLAGAQLGLLAVGLVGFAVTLHAGSFGLAPAFAGVLLLGFWVFVYNVGRTLARARPLDVTERHFSYALACFLVVSTLGLLLAVGFRVPGVLGPLDRTGVRGAHVALALFGGVLLTVFGALYQLVPMFAQSDLDAFDERLQSLEETGYTAGLLLLAAGRLLGHALLARLGGVLVLAGVLAVAVVMARRLRAASVEWGPMLRRYAVVPLAAVLWVAWTLPHWLADPLAYDAAFGAPGAFSILVLGVVGFVVTGTLYHVVPFIVWVNRYSDRLGFEEVPMIDDLYVDALAWADLALFGGGTALLVAGDAITLPRPVTTLGSVAVAFGLALFTLNLWLVVWRHATKPTLANRLGWSVGQQ